MSDLERSIISTLEKNPGFSDKELAEIVMGRENHPNTSIKNAGRW